MGPAQRTTLSHKLPTLRTPGWKRAVRMPLQGTPAPHAPVAPPSRSAIRPQGFQDMLTSSMANLAIAPGPAATPTFSGPGTRRGASGHSAAAGASSAASGNPAGAAWGASDGTEQGGQGEVARQPHRSQVRFSTLAGGASQTPRELSAALLEPVQLDTTQCVGVGPPGRTPGPRCLLGGAPSPCTGAIHLTPRRLLGTGHVPEEASETPGAATAPLDPMDTPAALALGLGLNPSPSPTLEAGAGEAAAARAPRTPCSAVRRREGGPVEGGEGSAVIGRPLRVATPVSRQRVGRSELRGLLGDAGGPSLGSRDALSPVRAPARLRDALGGIQVVTPVRRSQRGGPPAPPSTGALLRGAGFMYAPNQALAPRLTPAAGRAAGALSDAALAADLRGSLSPHAADGMTPGSDSSGASARGPSSTAASTATPATCSADTVSISSTGRGGAARWHPDPSPGPTSSGDPVRRLSALLSGDEEPPGSVPGPAGRRLSGGARRLSDPENLSPTEAAIRDGLRRSSRLRTPAKADAR
ncbi:hypothetical protein WJX81_003783 [Elliptochloris bilobata]|uniref:Uncharacterized protein n=1 Tax=Elliptochloris bilobata TaxID=381761 RepID=A0AAW1RUQ4_9CHLO